MQDSCRRAIPRSFRLHSILLVLAQPLIQSWLGPATHRERQQMRVTDINVGRAIGSDQALIENVTTFEHVGRKGVGSALGLRMRQAA